MAKFRAGVGLALGMLLVLSLVSLGADRYEAIAGDYQIDITNLGMPLVFYLRIEADGAFALSPNLGFEASESRGEGVLGESQGVYMMIYKEHSADNPKTATFQLDGPNLVFQSTLPYGSSNIRNSAEDADDPSIVYMLTAETLALAEYYGTYAGGHSKMAMGSTVDYVYTLTLKAGLRYEFESSFSMGGSAYTFSETGSWTVDGTQFTLVPADGSDVQGTIDANGDITVGILPSEMASSRTESLLRIATHADFAGTFVGEKVSPMYTAKTSLVLDMFGRYHYTADVGMPEPFEELGSYTLTGTEISFEPEDGDTYTGTLENQVVSGNFKVIGSMPGTALVMYNDSFLGTFSGEAAHEDVDYRTVLILNPDGSYELVVTDGAGDAVLESEGTFQLQRAMTLMLVLSGLDPAPMCSVGASELTFSIELPGVTTGSGMGGLGFSLKKQ